MAAELFGKTSLMQSAAQLFAAADERPYAGPALPRLVLRKFKRQSVRHVKAARG